MSRHLLLALLIPLVAACVPGAMQGTIDGETLVVRSAVFVESAHPTWGVFRTIILSDAPGLCAHLASHGFNPSNSKSLEFQFTRKYDDGHPVELDAGDYEIKGQSSRTASAWFSKLDSECYDQILSADGTATKGSISIDSIDLGTGGHARGSFDLTFGPNEDVVTGSFNAVHCKADLIFSWRDVECV